jgi:ABC-type bacteriocin/lantibiotic exporter with double-glycine peptidase domain
MIRYIYLILFLVLNQSFAQTDLGVLNDTNQVALIKSESIYCDIRHVNQYPYLCVAASAEMVLDYYGKRIDQKDIKRLVDNINYKDTDKRLYSFVYFNELVLGLKKVGFNWENKKFAGNDFKNGLNFIINELSNNRPVLVCVNRMYRIPHTLVLNGYSEKNNSVILIDPMLKSPGIRIISIDTFKKIWMVNGNRYLVST